MRRKEGTSLSGGETPHWSGKDAGRIPDFEGRIRRDSAAFGQKKKRKRHGQGFAGRSRRAHMAPGSCAGSSQNLFHTASVLCRAKEVSARITLVKLQAIESPHYPVLRTAAMRCRHPFALPPACACMPTFAISPRGLGPFRAANPGRTRSTVGARRSAWDARACVAAAMPMRYRLQGSLRTLSAAGRFNSHMHLHCTTVSRGVKGCAPGRAKPRVTPRTQPSRAP